MSVQYIKKIDSQVPIDILIPAAGLGKRMKSYGPKSLIKIKKNITIFDHQLKLIEKSLPKESRIILVTGFESDILMNSTPSRIIKLENERYEETNVVRSIGIGLRACHREVLIIYGDLVFNEECLNSMNYNNSSILLSNLMADKEVGCIVNRKDKIENMMYDLNPKWGQMVFLKGKELEMMKKYCWDNSNYKKLGFEALNYIISQGGSLLAINNINAKAIDIDSSKDLEIIKEII